MATTCKLCNVQLSSPAVYAQHIAGRAHQLKQQDSLAAQMQSLNLGRNAPNRQTRSGRATPSGAGAPRVNGPQANRSGRNTPSQRGAPQTASSRHPPPRGGRPSGNAPPTTTAATATPPRAGSRNQPQPQENVQYAIDFGVVRNTESGPNALSTDIVFSPPAPNSINLSDQRMTASIQPIKSSRTNSVQGFQIQSQNVVSPGRFRVFVKFNPQSLRRGVHVVQLRSEYFAGNFRDVRWLKVKGIIGAPEDHDELKPIAPFQGSMKLDANDWHRRKMVRGKQAVTTLDFTGLPYYDVPEDYRRTFKNEGKRGGDSIQINLQSLLLTDLNAQTYKNRWTYLLWHEELQTEVELKAYDMNGVTINRVQRHDYSLVVPGLAEKRPSVIVTDLIAMKEAGSSFDAPLYGGPVSDVKLSEVIIRLHETFPGLPNQRWDVRFTVNRLLFRRMHDAIGKGHLHERILFPNDSHKKATRDLPSPPSHDVAANPRQSLAVARVLAQSPGDVPFIISGPPGTGKTATLVEAVHRVIVADPKNRVLVCAPSNTATDLIASRLSKWHNNRELIRLTAPSRPYDALLPKLRDFSPAVDRRFTTPPKDELKKFRIVVSTCYYASIPRSLGVQDHFTHVFVDEAGNASEPELMVALLQNAGSKTNIVLSGDPMLLGPVVQSKACAALGMDVSFLERLMRMPIYRVHSSNPNIVKLIQNYRNHPAILNFSNTVFYMGEQESNANPIAVKSLERFSELPTPGFPIIFHSVCWENMREAKSPSYFNIGEATLVKHYVVALLSDQKLRLEPDDIGIISPYRQQCGKIRQLLRQVKRDGVDVKVTEDWQGLEKRIIIVSTVRSDPEIDGRKDDLGFVSSWRRTNVALSRAKALLIGMWRAPKLELVSHKHIVIGNGPTLERDPIWYFFLRYVHASQGWRGDSSSFSPNPTIDRFKPFNKANRNYDEFIEERWEALMAASQEWDLTNQGN